MSKRFKKMMFVRFSCLLWFLLAASAYSQEFSAEQQEKALALIGQLESESFTGREAAMSELENLPAEAVPWLDEMLELTGPSDIELRSRLKSIIRTLKKRVLEVGLTEGTMLKIDLPAARPEDVLAEMARLSGAPLELRNEKGFWADGSKKQFAFEGSYWEAIDALLETFPTRSADREDLSSSGYRMTRWRGDDFKFADRHTINNGIFRVRHARMALENDGGKDYLSVILMPSIEPCFEVDSLELTVKALALEDGTLLEPLNQTLAWQSMSRGSTFSPAGTFTWVFPLPKGTKLGAVAGIEAGATISVRRLSWSEIDLPEDLNDPVKMNANVQLELLEREEGKLKIKFEGKGREPAGFDDHSLRNESFKILDKDGKALEFNINNTSSGGGGDSWRNSYGGSIEGVPAKVKAHLPGAAQTLELKFDLFDLPMPGSSLGE